VLDGDELSPALRESANRAAARGRSARAPGKHARKALGAEPFDGDMQRHLAATCCGGSSKQAGRQRRPTVNRRGDIGGLVQVLRALLRPAAVGATPLPQLRPSLSPCAVCLSHAVCALPLVRLTSLPPASAAAARCGLRHGLETAAVGTATPLLFCYAPCVSCVCVAVLLSAAVRNELGLHLRDCMCAWTTGVMYSCDDPVRVCVHVSVVQLCAVERGERGRNRLWIPPWLTTAQPPRWDEAGDRSHAALEGMHVMLAWRLCVQSA
jgi:hypothetical protein